MLSILDFDALIKFDGRAARTASKKHINTVHAC